VTLVHQSVLHVRVASTVKAVRLSARRVRVASSALPAKAFAPNAPAVNSVSLVRLRAHAAMLAATVSKALLLASSARSVLMLRTRAPRLVCHARMASLLLLAVRIALNVSRANITTALADRAKIVRPVSTRFGVE
jgi:hypothetical protein